MEEIDHVLARDPAALAHVSWHRRLFLAEHVISSMARFLTGIEIHSAATVGRRVFIDHDLGVVIGETSEFGDDCTIYQGVTLSGTMLQPRGEAPSDPGQGRRGGAGAKILGGFTVGDGARITSNAVVLKGVSPQTTVAGIPPRRCRPYTRAQRSAQRP